jgi:hypothetical protein
MFMTQFIPNVQLYNLVPTLDPIPLAYGANYNELFLVSLSPSVNNNTTTYWENQ